MKRINCLAFMFSVFFLVLGIGTNAQQKTNVPRQIKGSIITVGVSDADITGTDNRAIQAAIDLVYQRGGGTVRILPG